MKFFQQTLLPDPLGGILAKARRESRLSMSEAARAAGIRESEALALETEAELDPSSARLHAVSYARALSVDPAAIRDSLPPPPCLIPSGRLYLSAMGRPPERRWRPPVEILAPLGKATLYLLLTGILLSTWGMMRQLSRVRSIPWITSAQPASFSPR
jgi:hypothetical protein